MSSILNCVRLLTVDVLDTNSDLKEALESRALPQIETLKVPLKGGYGEQYVFLFFKYMQFSQIISIF